MTVVESNERDVVVGPAEQRDRARAWLDERDFPTTHDERWKYTPVGDVVALWERTTPAEIRAVDPVLVDAVAGRHGPSRIVFVNGFHVPELSDTADTPGIWCGPLGAVPDHVQAAVALRLGDGPGDSFDALNLLADHDTAVIVVDENHAVTEPVHVVHLTLAGESAVTAHPRTVVVTGPRAEVAVIETFAASGGEALTNASTTIEVGAEASVTHHRIQTDTPGTTHLGHTTVHQATHSRYRATSVVLGADVTRHAFEVVQHGDHAVSDLDGVYTPVGRQRHDTVVTVDHTSDHGRSIQRFTGVIDDHAQGSFGGRVIVRADTAANDARQSNRNLLLTPNAQANTRPWLEILAEDVQCTHGATVGRLDQEAMFYLRSRGIPKAAARSMLIDGFIGEITESITPMSLRDHVTAAIAAHRTEHGS